jgi:ABC-type branched-subunit amino acid transport system substrate-binding protein
MKGKIILALVYSLLIAGTLFFALPTQAQPTVNIGIIGPWGIPHWGSPYSLPCGMWDAAQMAAAEINTLGGINVGGTLHTIVLHDANEYAVPTPNPTAAYAEMLSLIEVDDCDYVIGGFRTEVTTAIISASVDWYSTYPHLLFINGASTDDLINGTIAHLFRINPINSTMLFRNIAGAIGGYMLYASPPLPTPAWGNLPNQGYMWNIFKDPTVYTELAPGFVVPQVRVAVISEDLDWTVTMHTYLTNPGIYPSVLGPLANVTYQTRFSADPASPPDWGAIWTDVKNSGAKIVIHVCSGGFGTDLSSTFTDNNVEAMLVGINVMGQLQTHWASTSGKCEYETFLDFSGTYTPIVPVVTRTFWLNFMNTYGYWPIYPAWGAYDAIYALKEAMEATASTNHLTVKTYLETTTRQGLNGLQKYTSGRDIYTNMYAPIWPPPQYVRAMMVQWLDYNKEVVCPRAYSGDPPGHVPLPYAKVWAIPPNMYPLREDTNYDKYVGIDDIVFAADHFGTSPYPVTAPPYPPSSDRWEHVCDQNFDDYCGIDDIVLIAGAFGTSYP